MTELSEPALPRCESVKSASRGRLDALGDLVQRPVERARLPVVGERGAVQDLGDAVRVDGELEGVGPLGAERALVDGAFGIALDVDELAALGVDELAAADGAVGTDALGDGGAAQPRRLRQRSAG